MSEWLIIIWENITTYWKRRIQPPKEWGTRILHHEGQSKREDGKTQNDSNWYRIISAIHDIANQNRIANQQNDSHNERHVAWERRRFYIDVAAILVAAFGAFYLFRQQVTMQGQLDEMRDEQRPWLSADVIISDTIVFDEMGIRVPFGFVVKNTGKEPAFHANKDVNIYFDRTIVGSGSTEETQDADCQFANSAEHFGNGDSGIDYTIFPGDSIPMTETPIIKRADALRARQPDGTLTSPISGIVCITYYFANKKRHHTTYRFWINYRKGGTPDFGTISTVTPDILKIIPLGSYAD